MKPGIFSRVRGMNDLLPEEARHFARIESVARAVFEAAGFGEIRLPIVEDSGLFLRSIGEATDIVEKEMYEFKDRNGQSLALRPEATAGCVRAVIEHDLTRSGPQRLWYHGPMFRHERPQKGRHRQFHQIGAEVFGIATPDLEAELLLLSQCLWNRLGLDGLTLEINTLGTAEERARYREALTAYLAAHEGDLGLEDRERLTRNPLRLLDSKAPETQELLSRAPILLDTLGAASREHWQRVQTLLDAAGIPYQVNPRLVRGLDYYTQTVFEWVTPTRGAQTAVCSGGRYDGLVEQLGGPPTPAMGWALGLERLAALLEPAVAPRPLAALVTLGPLAEESGFALLQEIRRSHPDLPVMLLAGPGNLKSKLKRADRLRARWVLILGEDELAQNVVQVKALEAPPRVERVPRTRVVSQLIEWAGQTNPVP